MKPKDKYLVPVVARALDILALFDSPSRRLALSDVVDLSGASHSTAFRILHTLVQRGYLARDGRDYRRRTPTERLKIGFAALSERVAVSCDIARSIQAAASAAGFDLLLLNNDQDADRVVENARRFVKERVAVAIEFQNDWHAASIIADIYATAGIPAVAIHIPQPGAVYFGPDNFRAGRTAGVALGEFAAGHWRGRVDAVVLLDVPSGGPTLQGRMTGVLKGIEAVLGEVPPCRIVRTAGGEDRAAARAATQAAIDTHGRKSRFLIAGVSDDFALGALEAVVSAGAQKSAAIVSHDGSEKALAAIAQPGSPLIGTVAFFPEDYGSRLIEIASRLLRGEPVPPAVYVEHRLITSAMARRSLGTGEHDQAAHVS